MARRAADEVRRRGVPIILEPMPPNERRIIHLALANDPDVTTESIYEDEKRRVVIKPRRRLPTQR
jgi:spoIIIJ-associated protein